MAARAPGALRPARIGMTPQEGMLGFAMTTRRLLLGGLGLLGTMTLPPLAQALRCPVGRVSFPVADPAEDLRRVYPASLLQLALARSDCPAEIEGRYHYTQWRALSELRLGRLDVTMVAPRELAPGQGLVVPIPLRLGLLGLRLLIWREERLVEFSGLQDLAALKARRLGYGADWNDLETFERLGFQLVTASSYASLFAMLLAGRSDYLARGLNEVWGELEQARLRGEPLAVVPGLALRYPLDDYFVVRPDAPDLARALEQGLRQAQADGSYQALFEAHFGAALQRSRLEGRRWIKIPGYPADELVEQAQNRLLLTPPRSRGRRA